VFCIDAWVVRAVLGKDRPYSPLGLLHTEAEPDPLLPNDPDARPSLDEILTARDADDLIEWVRHKPLAHFENGILMVHAGVLPQWDVTLTLELAHELERALRAPNWKETLASLYGNEPHRWEDSLTGADRLRITYNAPVVLTFTLAAVAVFLITRSDAAKSWFMAYPGFEYGAHTYVGLFSHILGHQNWQHLIGNRGQRHRSPYRCKRDGLWVFGRQVDQPLHAVALVLDP
jgi:hypothetical protein